MWWWVDQPIANPISGSSFDVSFHVYYTHIAIAFSQPLSHSFYVITSFMF